jgi:hypothetical protein
LQITIDGVDPKAIFNFGFTVAPSHYYSADEQHPTGRVIDISNDKFGVDFASSDFQSRTIQSQQHVELPMGAGAFKVTNEDNSDTPTGSQFWEDSVVYFKANTNFMGGDPNFTVKAPKLRLQVVSSSNALDKLERGEVDYVEPQFTKANSERLKAMKANGFESASAWQLGYGYIGINAGKVPNINIRRAIMASMNTALACAFYEAGTCKPIDWPMSMESWAYPFIDKTAGTVVPNDTPYAQWIDADLSEVIEVRRRYFNETDTYRMMTLDASNPDEVQKLPDAERIVVVMEGLSMYLTNDALARFFTALQAKYKAVHVLLDIYTVFGAKASKYKNPINEVGVTQVYGIDDIHALVSDTGLRVVQECNMIPSHLVNELNGFDKVFFQRMFTGKTYQKIYRMYELATK